MAEQQRSRGKPGPKVKLPGKRQRPLPFGLSAKDRLIVAMAAKGKKKGEIAAELGFTPHMVKNSLQKPGTRAHLDRLLSYGEDAVVRQLRAGEALAIETALEILQDKELDPELRWTVSKDLLDRRGERGRPVERKLEATIDMSAEATERAVQAAFADPGVRAWLQQGGLKVLPPAVSEEVVMGSEVVCEEETETQTDAPAVHPVELPAVAGAGGAVGVDGGLPEQPDDAA